VQEVSYSQAAHMLQRWWVRLDDGSGA